MTTITQEKILNLLFSTEDLLTIRGIAKRLNKPYALVYNNLADLEKKGIISKKSVPPAHIISLNESAPSEIFIDIELRTKREFLKKHPWVEIMLEDMLSKQLFFIALVFGSYAKGKQTPKSDIDILIIVNEKKDINNIDSFNEIYTKTKKSPT